MGSACGSVIEHVLEPTSDPSTKNGGGEKKKNGLWTVVILCMSCICAHSHCEFTESNSDTAASEGHTLWLLQCFHLLLCDGP